MADFDAYLYVRWHIGARPLFAFLFALEGRFNAQLILEETSAGLRAGLLRELLADNQDVPRYSFQSI